MTRDDLGALHLCSATELVRLMRRREVSPLEVMEAVARRMEATEPHLNAFITETIDRAMTAARRAERASGDDLGLLHGVPFSVKDLLNTGGVRTTYGSFAFEQNIPPRSCVAVQRIEDAGGILIGKTTTPEFGHKPLTEAPLFGRTHNPWNLERTPGGSSGGAAASIAAGVGPLRWVPTAAVRREFQPLLAARWGLNKHWGWFLTTKRPMRSDYLPTLALSLVPLRTLGCCSR